MKRVASVSPMDIVGNPEPAALVDTSGLQVGLDTVDPPDQWCIAAFAPLDPFVRFLVAACARRPNFDHPRRLNIDQGWKPVSIESGCG
jgi:hypothetical protein